MKFREYVNKLTNDEFDQLLYSIYCCGVKDGNSGLADSPTNSFNSTYSERGASTNTLSLEEETGVPVHQTYLMKVNGGGI